ncbi:MAG: DUF421 domain-containing protein [Anaerolineae bacterium]
MDTVLRVTVICFFIFIGMKIVGKREFGQLSPMELVALLMIPESVSQALNRTDPSIANGLVGVATLFLLVLGFSIVSHSNGKLGALIEGMPSVLVQHGQLVVDQRTGR